MLSINVHVSPLLACIKNSCCASALWPPPLATLDRSRSPVTEVDKCWLGGQLWRAKTKRVENACFITTMSVVLFCFYF